MKKSIRQIFIIFSIISYSTGINAQPEKMSHIFSHNKTKVVTDPSKGYNAYKNWAIFPARSMEYRKVILYITYQCPDSLHCGEWDYVDNIYLRRTGGINELQKKLNWQG